MIIINIIIIYFNHMTLTDDFPSMGIRLVSLLILSISQFFFKILAIQSALVTTRWSGSMTSERVVSEARYRFCRQGELPSTSMLH